MHLYTVHHNDTRLGSLAGDELLSRHRAGEIPATALVWRPGLAEWGALGVVLAADGLLPPAAPAFMPPPLQGGGAGASDTPPPRPKSWLVPAILSTLCCCLPFGIAGIVFAAQVDGKYRAGDYAGAEKAAANAKKYTLLAIGLGFLVALVHLLVGTGL